MFSIFEIRDKSWVLMNELIEVLVRLMALASFCEEWSFNTTNEQMIAVTIPTIARIE